MVETDGSGAEFKRDFKARKSDRFALKSLYISVPVACSIVAVVWNLRGDIERFIQGNKQYVDERIKEVRSECGAEIAKERERSELDNQRLRSEISNVQQTVTRLLERRWK